MKPTIGRKVLFWLNGSKITGKNIDVFVPEQPLDATIVCVWGDRMVNLRVTDHGGESHSVRSVTLRQDGDIAPVGMYCEWMPYQVRQAAQPAAAVSATDTTKPASQDVAIENYVSKSFMDCSASAPSQPDSVSDSLRSGGGGDFGGGGASASWASDCASSSSSGSDSGSSSDSSSCSSGGD